MARSGLATASATDQRPPTAFCHGLRDTGPAAWADHRSQRPSTASATDLGTPVPHLGGGSWSTATDQRSSTAFDTDSGTPAPQLGRTWWHRGGSDMQRRFVALATDQRPFIASADHATRPCRDFVSVPCPWSPAGAGAERGQDTMALATDLGTLVPLLGLIMARSGPQPPWPQTWGHRSRYLGESSSADPGTQRPLSLLPQPWRHRYRDQGGSGSGSATTSVTDLGTPVPPSSGSWSTATNQRPSAAFGRTEGTPVLAEPGWIWCAAALHLLGHGPAAPPSPRRILTRGGTPLS